MVFGRCFENALGTYFRGEDCGAALFKEWGAFRNTPFEYKKGETWYRLVHRGCPFAPEVCIRGRHVDTHAVCHLY